MRVVVQRVTQAAVEAIENGTRRETGNIGVGYLLLVGVKGDDTDADARYLADKIRHLRVWEDENGKLNRSLPEVGGSVLLVSNFTLYGDCRKGRRPSFTAAASGAQVETLYRLLGELLAAEGIPTQYGVFGAEMQVALVNDGPVTLLLDSRKEF